MKLSALLLAVTALGACSQTVPQQSSSQETTLSASEALDIASAAASCSHGAINAERSFVLCEDGALRRDQVEMALARPVDTALDIDAIAKRYNRVSQELTGIETSTYGSILPKDRRVAALATPIKPTAADRDTVWVGQELFDVYRLNRDGKSGTIFVQRPVAPQE